MNIQPEDVLRIVSYFTIIHHIKGRIRARVNPKIKELGKGLHVEDIEQLAQKIKGIKSIKINKVVASITIEYDESIFPSHLWEELVRGENAPALTQRIRAIYQEVC